MTEDQDAQDSSALQWFARRCCNLHHRLSTIKGCPIFGQPFIYSKGNKYKDL